MASGISHGTSPSITQRWRWGLLLTWLAVTTVTFVTGQEGPPGIHAYPLRHATADDVVVRLRKLLMESSSDAKVFSDPQSNQILIQGSPATQQLAARMLQTLDQPADPVAGPAARNREVKGYRVDGDLTSLVTRLQQRFPPSTGARIAADERTRQVIVIGPTEVQREVAQLLQQGQIPAQPLAPPAIPGAIHAANKLVHPLQNITWRDLEGELVRLWGDQLQVTRARNGEIVNVSIAAANGSQPVIQIDRRSAEVSFTGTGRTVDQWRRVVEALDSPHDGNQSTQLVALRNADPALVQSTVSLLNQSTAPPEDEVTQAVPRSNRKRNAADLVSMLFQQPGEQARKADPAQPAAPAQPAPATPAPGEEPAGDGDLGLIGSVQIEIINDTIIIRGNKRDVERVKKLIEEIDKISELTRPEVEVYHLQHINGEAATTLVSELYTEILADRTGQVTIRALGDPNAILLIGRKESLDVVKELIEKLDRPSPPSSKFEIFRLKYVSAVDAELTVRNFFVNRPGTDTTIRTGLGIRVQIVADFRTNSLIVQASPRDMEEVRRLVESIDVADVADGPAFELRVFPLKNALAETLATVLQSAISGQAAPGTQQQGGQGQQPQQQQQGQGGSTTPAQSRLASGSLQLTVVDQESGRLLRSGILADVQVTADTNNNSLIVRAPARSMELIAALIEQLDKLPDASAEVKVFEIVNGNATSLATMLQTLFGQQATTGQGANQNAFGGLVGGLQQQQTATAGGESSLVPLRFSIDQRTNSIVASGSESDLQVVETILLRLDESKDDRRLSVVRLRNTQASSVATAIQQYLTNLQQQVQQQLLSNQSISAFESVERQVFVIPENVTNSLIVSATPRYQDEILKVIQDLDIRPPMVMVQVLIAEVLLEDTLEIGSEFGLQDSLVFDRGKAVPPVTNGPSSPGFNFNGSDVNLLGNSPLPSYPNVNNYAQETLAGQALSHFATGHTNNALGYGGLVLSAANESVSILLRALQDEKRLQILSRPQVMTMHNQPAYVLVGANVARPGETTVTGLSVQQSINYEDTGLILSILPLINDDGVIVLGVEAERSALGPESDPNTSFVSDGAGGVTPIRPLNITRASTTISARDGQTVVFAGLIQKSNESNSRRVPYLSDVPFLGNLFKFESSNERRTELLVVMTPYLVRDDADVEMIKRQESERMSWCLADVVNVTGDWGLQGGHCAFCKTDAPLIFPDNDPTGTMDFPTPAAPEMHLHSSAHESPSSRRGPALQPLPEPTDSDGVVGPPVPHLESSATRPTNVTSGPPAAEVTPAAYRAVRLPTPK